MIVTEEHEEQVTGSFCGFTMSSTKMTPLSPARAMSSINTVLMQCKERQQFPRSGSLHLCRTTFSYYILNSLRVPNETKKVNGVAFFSLCLHNLLSFRMLFLYSYPLHCCHSGFIQFSLLFNQVHSSLEIFIFIPRQPHSHCNQICTEFVICRMLKAKMTVIYLSLCILTFQQKFRFQYCLQLGHGSITQLNSYVFVFYNREKNNKSSMYIVQLSPSKPRANKL